MSKPKAPKEIKNAKEDLEVEIRETLHLITKRFHERHPGWLITDLDIGIIDVSTKEKRSRMTATARAELTSSDLKMKICKGGLVKELKS